MPAMSSSRHRAAGCPSIDADTAADWDAWPSPHAASNARYNPFVSHGFFAALEDSRSACARTGWGPRHLIARQDGAGSSASCPAI